jgi:hypothetical protein
MEQFTCTAAPAWVLPSVTVVGCGAVGVPMTTNCCCVLYWHAAAPSPGLLPAPRVAVMYTRAEGGALEHAGTAMHARIAGHAT